ncbi:hypothetical protein G7047_14225 [Diaphorobacter sp. HDW4A]|uniref:hypothetical protein n=1 Tax=Diaphorobacter sp. HDW4A TaxID=2714924 RepID=UPI00140D7912|nr:hypothetical protein [Diaphorobacter sp. HDW4A]QIL80927.1 hypothetical protein G7047_14225 [Diaphorobacter sp. HDW4A]
MNEHTLNELRDALSALRTDIAIALPWEALHRWFGIAPLDQEHYSEINRQWSQTWHQAGKNHPVPTVYLYHGVEKLTLVRETTPNDPPAIDLQVLACATLDKKERLVSRPFSQSKRSKMQRET